MKSSTLGLENSIHRASYLQLKDIIKRAEERYSTTITIEEDLGSTTSWLDDKVYLVGDRNVVNIVCLRLINWQHRRGYFPRHGFLYVLPAEERK